MELPPGTNWIDALITWIVVGSIIAAIVWGRLQAHQVARGERVCQLLAESLIAITSGMAVVFVVGWVFLFKLGLVSPLWIVWGVADAMSRITLSQIAPIAVFAVALWALTGKFVAGYTMRTLWLAAGSMAGWLFDLALCRLH